MAFVFDEVQVNDGQFFVAENGKNPKALGEGEKKVKHSAYIEGPLQVGNDGDFSSAEGTVMIGADGNAGASKALSVKGDIDQDGNIVTTGTIDTNGSQINVGFVNGTGASAAVKAFDIEHPSKSGHRLRHICLEGPESAIYYRGRLKNEKVIRLPYYWKDLVNIDTISVQLQPIGAHQNIIVKRWDDEYVYLQAQGALPINCFFHVYAERKDVEKLIPEYEGTSVDDYPGDNSVYSINK
tara:strand:- start:342 stop:1058 length:717 start_codon:yes stop_codon:yes gene_type:complete